MRAKYHFPTLLLIGIAIFLGIQLGGGKIAAQDSAASEENKEISFDLGGGIKLELMPIQPGSFLMGDEKGESEEKPVHKVTITKPFYLGKFEVTQEQWDAVMGGNRSHFKGAKNPGG